MKNEKKISEILEEIKTLDYMLTERIVDFHEVEGHTQARHAYVYYRSLLWDIRDKINELK